MFLFQAIEEQKNQLCYNFTDGKKSNKTILRLDCRNVEPISFHVKKVNNNTFLMLKNISIFHLFRTLSQ